MNFTFVWLLTAERRLDFVVIVLFHLHHPQIELPFSLCNPHSVLAVRMPGCVIVLLFIRREPFQIAAINSASIDLVIAGADWK